MIAVRVVRLMCLLAQRFSYKLYYNCWSIVFLGFVDPNILCLLVMLGVAFNLIGTCCIYWLLWNDIIQKKRVGAKTFWVKLIFPSPEFNWNSSAVFKVYFLMFRVFIFFLIVRRYASFTRVTICLLSSFLIIHRCLNSFYNTSD